MICYGHAVSSNFWQTPENPGQAKADTAVPNGGNNRLPLVPCRCWRMPGITATYLSTAPPPYHASEDLSVKEVDTSNVLASESTEDIFMFNSKQRDYVILPEVKVLCVNQT